MGSLNRAALGALALLGASTALPMAPAATHDSSAEAATASSADVVTSKEDRLLRRADVSVTLAVSDPEVREALGDLAGARLRLALEVSEINRPVQVADPTAR